MSETTEMTWDEFRSDIRLPDLAREIVAWINGLRGEAEYEPGVSIGPLGYGQPPHPARIRVRLADGTDGYMEPGDTVVATDRWVPGNRPGLPLPVSVRAFTIRKGADRG